MSRFFRYTWRFKPVKSLTLVCLFAVVFLNLYVIHFESYGRTAKRSTVFKIDENWYKQLQKLSKKGFQFTKLVEDTDTAVITFSKKQNRNFDENEEEEEKEKRDVVNHSNGMKIQNKKNAIDEINLNKLDIQAKPKEIFESRQSEREVEIENDREKKASSEVIVPTDDITKCPNNTLGHEKMTSYGNCRPHQPSLEGCREADRAYYYGPDKCDSFQGDICAVSVEVRNDHIKLKAWCNSSLCQEGDELLSIKTLDHDTGMHDIAGRYSTIKQLENNLPSRLIASHSNGYNYVFVQCQSKHGGPISQLLTLDPRYTVKESQSKRYQNLLNINIVLLDSVSRDHFYRSLPKTIQTFKRVATSASSPVKIFDFELFQAVEGHTAENTHALFTGSLFPPNTSRDAVRPVGMEMLFGEFKRAGYQTMWQEDLCWEGQWGLITDLAMQYNWNDLAPKLKQVYIDHTGLRCYCLLYKRFNHLH